MGNRPEPSRVAENDPRKTAGGGTELGAIVITEDNAKRQLLPTLTHSEREIVLIGDAAILTGLPPLLRADSLSPI